MKAKPAPGWMHVDTRFTKVCAICRHWNDRTEQHLAVSVTPDHVYYDAHAREFCMQKRCETYGGQPGCPYFSRSV